MTPLSAKKPILKNRTSFQKPLNNNCINIETVDNQKLRAKSVALDVEDEDEDVYGATGRTNKFQNGHDLSFGESLRQEDASGKTSN